MKVNRILSAILALALILGMMSTGVFAAEEISAAETPQAEVTRLEAMTLKAGEYNVWTGALNEGTEDLPLEIVMNFKAKDSAEAVESSYYKEYLTDFYLTINGLSSDSITADNCYLAGNYGEFGWIVIPTDGQILENGVTYPVVSGYDANITYEQICNGVKDFTAAIHVDEAILDANPNMTVELELRMKNPENPDDVLKVGEPATYTAAQLRGEPQAEVTRLEAMTLTAAEHEYMCWPSGDTTIDRPLEIVMNFKAKETAEEVKFSPWKQWKVDFYLTLEGLANGSITADNCYLAGNYGEFGWIVIPTDGTELENGVTYPVVSGYDANITYKQICDSVKDFTAAIHVDEAILDANPDMTVKLELKITNPDNANEVFVIGDPSIYTAAQLRGEPQAEVTRLEAMTLTQAEHEYMCWPSGDKTIDRPLEIVMNFKAKETAEEVKFSPWKQWKVDFYLTLEGLENGSITADKCYLAGNYGEFGWIVIPTDGTELENGVTYPVVSGYDANITYKQICDSVKDFTAAIHVDQAILDANPDMTVKLELKITNPDNANEVFTIGEPAIYTVDDLKNKEEEIEISDSFGTVNARVFYGLNEAETHYVYTALSTIDSLKYRKVGFIVTFGEQQVTKETTTVYNVIKARGSDGVVRDYTAAAFEGNGKYIFGQNINFALKYIGETFKFRPFAEKLDGTIIYGKETEVTVGNK